MGKGRRLTTSLSERLLGGGTYSYGNGRVDTAGTELLEEDVWSMVDDVSEREDQINGFSQVEWGPRAVLESGGGRLSPTPRTRRRISRDHGGRHVGGLSLAFEDPSHHDDVTMPASRIVHQLCGPPTPTRHMATSAPVNVLDWSKILRVESDEGFDEEDDSEMVPPHEYLARRKMDGASVFEGVGRTLKGRDMRRVRDAVWSQTGFDG